MILPGNVKLPVVSKFQTYPLLTMLPAIGNTRLPSDLKLQLLPLAMTFTLPAPLPIMLTAPTMLPAVGNVQLPSDLKAQVLMLAVTFILPVPFPVISRF